MAPTHKFTLVGHTTLSLKDVATHDVVSTSIYEYLTIVRNCFVQALLYYIFLYNAVFDTSLQKLYFSSVKHTHLPKSQSQQLKVHLLLLPSLCGDSFVVD